MSKKDLAKVNADLSALAGNLPTQRAGEPKKKRTSNPLLEEEMIQFFFGLRKSLRKQLSQLAMDKDLTMRAFVLDALKEKGASRVVAYCTHAVLSGGALDTITASQLDELIVADSIPLSNEALNCDKIRQLTISKLLAESIRRVSNEESLSAMFT